MKLNYKRTVIIGFAFMSILAFWQFYDQVIPYLLENVFGLKTLPTNAIMAIDNVLALFMLPLFGSLSDRTKTRLGKRTPYILFGTVVAVILMVLLAIFTQRVMFSAFMAALILLLFVMSTYRTPAVAYMPDVTEKPLRSKANAIINLVGYLGGIFATVMMMILLKSHKNADGESVYDAGQSFIPIFLIIAGFMLVSVLAMVLLVKENKLPHIVDDDEPETKSENGKMPRPVFKSLVLILTSVFLWYAAYNAVTTAFSRYCVNVWNVDLGTSSSYLLFATVAAIAAFVPLGFISGKLGRKKTVLIGVALMTLSYFAAIFIRHQSIFMYVVFAVVGIGWAAINVNSFPMVVEMSTGADIGKYTGFYYTFSTAAQITTPLLSGLLIDKLSIGYDVLFPYAVVFSALSFVTMCFVKHGDSKPETKAAILENFSSED